MISHFVTLILFLGESVHSKNHLQLVVFAPLRMGNRSAKHISETIVPDQDPLLKTSFPLTRRIVHADITRDFDIKTQVLGTGYSGAVRLAEHKITKQPVAVKQFSKTGLKAHRLKLLKSEVEVYLRLDHPNICRLLYAYESSRDVWLVMELCSCELYSRLCKSKVGVFCFSLLRCLSLSLLFGFNLDLRPLHW